MTDEPTIKQQIDETKSTVQQTWNDLSDMGEILDKAAGNIEVTKSILQRLYKNQIYLEQELKKTIAVEVEKQIQPIIDKLNTLTTQNPQFVYVKKPFHFFGWFWKRKKDPPPVD